MEMNIIDPEILMIAMIGNIYVYDDDFMMIL